MDLQKLSNQELLKLAKEKSSNERAITLEVIKLIREVERRRLFLDLGYGSLFDYVTRELKYVESAALRRIAASRLLTQIPEIEEKISNGNLSLSNLSQAQSFFRKEEKIQNKKLGLEEKKEVLSQLENKSTRQAQKLFLEISPDQGVLKESQKPVTATHTEIKIIVDDLTYEKLQKLKNLLSHKNSNMSFGELISEISDMALKDLDRTFKQPDPASKERLKKNISPSLPAAAQVQNDPKIIKPNHHISANGANHYTKVTSRYIPASGISRYIQAKVKKEVWLRDKGKCTFIDPLTQRQCGSTYKMEFHHVHAFAKGGKNTSNNIKLLCANHNAFMAIRDFGKCKMGEFMKVH